MKINDLLQDKSGNKYNVIDLNSDYVVLEEHFLARKKFGKHEMNPAPPARLKINKKALSNMGFYRA